MENNKTLYHYKPFHTLEHFTHLQNFLNQKLWFTRLDNFNDPFEGKFIYKRDTAQDILSSEDKFKQL